MPCTLSSHQRRGGRGERRGRPARVLAVGTITPDEVGTVRASIVIMVINERLHHCLDVGIARSSVCEGGSEMVWRSREQTSARKMQVIPFACSAISSQISDVISYSQQHPTSLFEPRSSLSAGKGSAQSSVTKAALSVRSVSSLV